MQVTGDKFFSFVRCRKLPRNTFLNTGEMHEGTVSVLMECALFRVSALWGYTERTRREKVEGIRPKLDEEHLTTLLYIPGIQV